MSKDDLRVIYTSDNIINFNPIEFVKKEINNDMLSSLSKFMRHYTDSHGNTVEHEGELYYFQSIDGTITVIMLPWARPIGREDDTEYADVMIVKDNEKEYRVYYQNFYNPIDYKANDNKDIFWTIFRKEINPNINITESEVDKSLNNIIFNLKSPVFNYREYINQIIIMYVSKYFLKRPSELLGE